MKKKSVSIIGAASISAAFIMKFIARHKNAELKHVYSTSQKGKKVSSHHTFLTRIVDAEYEMLNIEGLLNDSDVIFITRQHGRFLNETALLVLESIDKKKDIKFIDLSADFRLKDTDLYKQWYGVDHKHKDILRKAVYGLPELYKNKIKNAPLVANPGCYPTCAVLSLAPFIKEKIKYDNIVINALSGISGGGIRPTSKNIAVNVLENIFAYKVGGAHPHTPEIEQELGNINGNVKVTFVPHVAPFKYGIIETIYIKLQEKAEERLLYNTYSEFYKGARFVNVLEPPMLPQVKDVVGTNFVNIGFKLDPRTNTLIIISCIDNIIKGAAGQAVQNMNIMCGFDEGEGLV
jgi:N-acetyl-gamma-glutamyl-phosphate reductase